MAPPPTEKNFPFHSPVSSFCCPERDIRFIFTTDTPGFGRDRRGTNHAQGVRLDCWHERGTLKLLGDAASSPKRGRGRVHRRLLTRLAPRPWKGFHIQAELPAAAFTTQVQKQDRPGGSERTERTTLGSVTRCHTFCRVFYLHDFLQPE